MKLEKINNDKIKCIIGSDELANRHIEVEKLKYGSSETKALFKDIMDMAYKEFGFDINGVPLMIEAIPLSNGEIMLIVTKVSEKEQQAQMTKNMNLENHTFEKANAEETKQVSINQAELSKGYFTVSLSKFEDLLILAKNLEDFITEESSLFFDEASEKYYLYLKINDKIGLYLNTIYMQISEFSPEPIRTYEYNYLNEKFTLIEADNAIEKCRLLN